MAKKTTKSMTKVSEREYRLFRHLDVESQGTVSAGTVLETLEAMGIGSQDERVRDVVYGVKRLKASTRLDPEAFCELIRPNIQIVEKAIQGQTVIPEFGAFTKEIEGIYEKTQGNKGGEVANYIPQLGRVNPDQYGVSVCTIDGQRYAIGDHSTDFCVQSCSKPITYCLALEEHGEDVVHKYIGREPSGRGFNELTLNHDGRPHNPMINSGAIMACSLVRPDLDIADRFDHVTDKWRALVGDQKIGFSNSVYLSERATADRNFALGYFMQENKAFPEWADMIKTLEFYFQVCSLELNADKMSIIAGTLANGGVCPVTNKTIFNPRTVQNCLSLMYSCGMYDFSGEFAFTIGLPAKSGVAGALMIVVPNVMGICTWSPRLDAHGNSVRGIHFCRELVSTFNVHNYDNLTGLTEKKDPRTPQVNKLAESVTTLTWAASKGDLVALRRLECQGADIHGADYDGRTPLHLAAAEGHMDVVSFLVKRKVLLNPKDRWGGTPLADAKRHGHSQVASFLSDSGAR